MLSVEKFVLKPQFEIEAAEFTGGIDQGCELMVWIVEGGGQAIWNDEVPGEWNRCGMREHIRITEGSAYMFAYVGDHIVRDENGRFKPLRKGLIDAKYNKISEPVPLRLIKEEPEELLVA